MNKVVTVELGARAYDVIIGQGVLAQAGRLIGPLAKRGRVAIVADTNAWRLHGRLLVESLSAAGIDHDLIDLPPGEASKSFASLERVIEALLGLGLERGDLILAFGGGVTGDLAGFAAAITKRGVDFVQIPTTLLAQVDSSVGGKTAINATAGKNLIGAFWQPRLVLADIDLLETLHPRDLAAGWAEVLKISLIEQNDFFDWCQANGPAAMAGEPLARKQGVWQAVCAKARIVAQDEREGGVRALLNLGHTFGHAFEACVGFNEGILRHGEAVACGVAMAHRYSASLGLCPEDDARQVEAALEAVGLAAFPSELAGGPWSAQALLDAMMHDKKNENGQLTLILSRGIGSAFVQRGAASQSVLQFLTEDLAR